MLLSTLSPRKLLIPLGLLALGVWGYRAWGWGGLAFALGGIVLWLLLHFTRMMQVVRRAANNPMGYVDSAVMLQARLRPGQILLDVVGLTRSLGEPAGNDQAEAYRWTDASGACVTCEFVQGRLLRWNFQRPADSAATTVSPGP